MKKKAEWVWKAGIILCVAVSVCMGCLYLMQIFTGKIITSFFDMLAKWPTFSEQCVTTEDGFVYYIDNEIGLCILELPDSEDVEIPEYIDGHLVAQLGYKKRELMYESEYYVEGDNVKRLTVQHSPNYAYTRFNNVETLVYLDYVYIYLNDQRDTIKISDRGYSALVELKKGDKQINFEDFKATVIEIPEYVVKIDAGVFDGLTGVTIKTSYESKPDGWEDGWNGNCEVIWGAELDE